MTSDESPSATAFVPGHITGFFSAHPAADSRHAGSRGAGVALTDGVRVTVSRGAGVRLNGDSVEIAAVDRVFDALGIDGGVDAETPLPLGTGFGVSGALALGTALAANAVFDCGRTENELITLAHCADVDAGTGLGDVVAQARGGLPIRLEPGAPGIGELDAIVDAPRIEYLTFGEMSTEAVLGGNTDRLSAAGERALNRLLAEPTVDRFMTVSSEFADEAGLLTPAVADAIAAVEASGGRAAMPMLGRTVFATGRSLSAAGFEPHVCGVDFAGGRLNRVVDADGTCSLAAGEPTESVRREPAGRK